MSEMSDLADRLFEAAVRGDVDAIRSLYRDDLAVWHNWDDAEQTKEESLETVRSFSTKYDTFGYSDVRTTVIEGGFLRQHAIRATRGGRSAHVPAILRVYVEDGLVYRVEEYFDRGQLIQALE